MHVFPCTPDCPLEIYADWLEDHDIGPGEIRLLAQGWYLMGYGWHRNNQGQGKNANRGNGFFWMNEYFDLGNGSFVDYGDGYYC